ncbi:MAG: hypothetical protein ACRDLF_14845 [Solirubrobacteraceae bacterium]
MSAAVYEIRIKGGMSEQLLAAFEGMESTVHSAETVLRGPALDQAALHGVLDRVQALGLELIEVRRLSESSTAEGRRR